MNDRKKVLDINNVDHNHSHSNFPRLSHDVSAHFSPIIDETMSDYEKPLLDLFYQWSFSNGMIEELSVQKKSISGWRPFPIVRKYSDLSIVVVAIRPPYSILQKIQSNILLKRILWKNLLDKIRKSLVDEDIETMDWQPRLVHEQTMNNNLYLVDTFHFQYHQITMPNPHNQVLTTKI